ncbi:peroxiredoxin family protein [Arundinibacter roseus]|uniref:TlpA family protein disulfide reductase n=1 Tax=Arundinibacter roseus TaxID=2070510 RepID=A0A4R4KL64_9BACT|nr:TlpA disulfide reductase family protein [Arundinibacter roseus]TDB68978.1 TlpA family protein disulfide reductase [Arundinibacter roseus]
MKHLSRWLLVIFSTSFVACTSSQSPELKTGIWRATLLREAHTLPFLLDIQPNSDGKTYTAFALNGSERLKLDTAYIANDSLHIPMELFDSELIGKIDGDQIKGVWRRYRVGQFAGELPFEASFGEEYRFFKPDPAAKTPSVNGKWAVTFQGETGKDSAVAVGIFDQQGATVTGTFLTPTGDYRYLAGDVRGDSLYLSCFDGSHIFLFKAKIQADGSLKGGFWAGTTWYENWTAQRNDNATLPDANSLTYLKPGYETLDFSFPDASGKQVSLQDPAYKNKVVVVQIMGSWCPNCMDETNFLSPWYKKNRERGVEIIGLAFERSDKLEVSAPKMKRMAERYQVEYPILLAGLSDKDSAARALPMLNHVMSFPTTLIVDKKGKVRSIHTGFSGPGTGKYYDDFVEDFNRLIDKLVSE